MALSLIPVASKTEREPSALDTHLKPAFSTLEEELQQEISVREKLKELIGRKNQYQVLKTSLGVLKRRVSNLVSRLDAEFLEAAL